MSEEIREAIYKAHGNAVYLEAEYTDGAAANDIMSRVQAALDGGQYAADFWGHEVAPEDQLAQAAADVYSRLRNIVITSWLSKYTPAEMLSLVDLMVRTPSGAYAKVAIIDGVTLTIAEIVGEWNDRHESGELICLRPDT